jgi:hypothetical protein
MVCLCADEMCDSEGSLLARRRDGSGYAEDRILIPVYTNRILANVSLSESIRSLGPGLLRIYLLIINIAAPSTTAKISL